MEIHITVDYNVKQDDFDNLSKVYPLGKYIGQGRSQWFRLNIDSEDGKVELVWFREW